MLERILQSAGGTCSGQDSRKHRVGRPAACGAEHTATVKIHEATLGLTVWRGRVRRHALFLRARGEGELETRGLIAAEEPSARRDCEDVLQATRELDLEEDGDPRGVVHRDNSGGGKPEAGRLEEEGRRGGLRRKAQGVAELLDLHDSDGRQRALADEPQGLCKGVVVVECDGQVEFVPGRIALRRSRDTRQQTGGGVHTAPPHCLERCSTQPLMPFLSAPNHKALQIS